MQQTLSLSSILEIHTLSSGASKALFGLLSFRNKETGRCCPRITTLSQRLGVPYGTLRRWLRELRLAGVVESTKHRGSNSYRIDLSKSCGETCGRSTQSGPCQRPKMDRRDSPEMDGQERPKMDGLDAPFLYEQTVFEQTGRNSAAAVKASPVVEGPEENAAAAAAPPPRQQGKQRPASPPVSRQQPEQLGLNLEPEEPTAPVDVPPPPDQIAGLAQAMAQELGKVHPSPGLPHRAPPEIERILRAASNVEATAERMWNNHAAWMEYWATLSFDRFIPHLWRWVRDGDWENPPVFRKPMSKARMQSELRKREFLERMERRDQERARRPAC